MEQPPKYETSKSIVAKFLESKKISAESVTTQILDEVIRLAPRDEVFTVSDEGLKTDCETSANDLERKDVKFVVEKKG